MRVNLAERLLEQHLHETVCARDEGAPVVLRCAGRTARQRRVRVRRTHRAWCLGVLCKLPCASGYWLRGVRARCALGVHACQHAPCCPVPPCWHRDTGAHVSASSARLLLSLLRMAECSARTRGVSRSSVVVGRSPDPNSIWMAPRAVPAMRSSAKSARNSLCYDRRGASFVTPGRAPHASARGANRALAERRASKLPSRPDGGRGSSPRSALSAGGLGRAARTRCAQPPALSLSPEPEP